MDDNDFPASPLSRSNIRNPLRGLTIVYSAALGGWAFLFAQSVLELLTLMTNKGVVLISAVVGVLVAGLFVWKLKGFGRSVEARNEEIIANARAKMQALKGGQ